MKELLKVLLNRTLAPSKTPIYS